jgi:hypothetical protein
MDGVETRMRLLVILLLVIVSSASLTHSQRKGVGLGSRNANLRQRTEPSQLHIAPCPSWPCPHTASSPCRSEPSIALRASCRLRLEEGQLTEQAPAEVGQHTELDVWVLLANFLAVVVREEHVSGKATLWRIGICDLLEFVNQSVGDYLTLLALATVGLALGLAGLAGFLRHDYAFGSAGGMRIDCSGLMSVEVGKSVDLSHWLGQDASNEA